MAKASTRTTDKVSALIAEIEAEAYARGRADARTELLKFLGATEGRRGLGRTERGRRPAKAVRKRRAAARKRAPKGSVPRFVQRVLGERQDATVAEIVGHAASEEERSIKPASIRVELRNGRMQGRYVLDNGRWSLMATDAPAAAPVEAEASSDPPHDGTGASSETPGKEGRGTIGLRL